MATQYTAGLSAGQILTAATMNSIGAAWEAYTPTLSGWTQGNGYFISAYCRINKLVIYRGAFYGGSTTVQASFFDLSLPVAANGYYDTYKQPLVSANYYDDSTGANYSLQGLWISSTVRLGAMNTAGTYAQANNLGAGVPATYAAGDWVSWTIAYEAA
jgi:hypothetical protein